MRDAVAEVLLERRAMLPRRSPTLVVSLGLHLLLGVALVIAARPRPSLPQRSNVLNIRLAPRTQLPVPPAAAPPVAKPAPAAPAVKKPKVEKAAEKTPPKKPVEKALFGKSTEKPSAPKSTTAAQSAVPVPAVIPAGSTGVASLEGGDFPYTIYIDRMLTLIGMNWARPEVSGGASAQVYFVIERDGRLRDIEIEKSSGVPTFDRAARRAVMEASPLPPLPYAYSGNHLGVHLTFH